MSCKYGGKEFIDVGKWSAGVFGSKQVIVALRFCDAAMGYACVDCSIPAGTGNIQIDTRRLRAGSYNFTVYRGGKVADNGKVLIR